MTFQDFLNRDPAYNGIMERLLDTMSQLEVEAAKVPTLNQDVKDAEVHMDAVQTSIVIASGGWKGLGSNDKDRQLALDAKLIDSDQYQKIYADLRRIRAQRDEVQSRVETLQRILSGVGYGARLHSSMVLAYSGVRVELPVTQAQDTSLEDELEGLNL